MNTDRVTAIYDAIDAFQRTHRLPGLQHAQIRGLLAEHLARALPAVSSVPPPADRAAVRAQAFRDAAGWAYLNVHATAVEGVRRWLLALADDELRRMAAEEQPTETQASGCDRCGHGHGAHNISGCAECPGGWRADHRFVSPTTAQPAVGEQPETQAPEDDEAEKLAKARRMAKAFSAPPVAPPEWATTTEWPGRHKRAGDRRVHATAAFEVNDVRRFWTACGKNVGQGGYPLSHMPVDCRSCQRAITTAERPAVGEQPETQEARP